jgi:uncharacterized membrane protein
MNYIFRAFFVSIIWSILIICDSFLGIKHFRAGMFFKMTIYGLSILVMYFFIKKKLHEEINDLWKNNRRFLIIYIIFLLSTSGIVQYLYLSSHNKSNGHSHIVIPITIILPAALSILGTWIFLKEKINKESVLGITLMLIGSFILATNN